MRTTRIEADERGLFRRGLRGLHGFFHYNKEINPCNPRLTFYSLITFLYSATAIFSARCALIRFVCACVHDNCAVNTSAILDFPSL